MLRMIMKYIREIVLVLVIAIAGGIAGHLVIAQDQGEAAGPVLTDVQKLQLQNLSLQLEIAQLKYQIAQKDFDTTKADITKLVQSLQVSGYTLNLQNLVYIKNPDPPKE